MVSQLRIRIEQIGRVSYPLCTLPRRIQRDYFYTYFYKDELIEIKRPQLNKAAF